MPILNIQEHALLAQSVERETLNLKVAGSTPAQGFNLLAFSGAVEGGGVGGF